MKKLDAILEKIHIRANFPTQAVHEYITHGRKVAGCFPVYASEEILHAGGFIPFGLWGTQITPTVAGKYNPIFTCSIMRSCLELGMTGKYDGLSCVVMPILCDTFRGMSAAWRVAVPNLPLFSFIYPQNRTNLAAKSFMVEEYRHLLERIESFFDIKISMENLAKSIDIYNNHSAVMRNFVTLAPDHLDVITPLVRHEVIKSALFTEKEEHTKLMKDLVTEIEGLPKYRWEGKKVILSGILAEPAEFLNIFTENGIAVVGDDLAQESRQYRTPIPEKDSPLEALSEQWIARSCCSVVHEVSSSRANYLVNMAKAQNADGVAICLMRFCDVEEYEFPFLQKEIEAAGLHCLCLEIDQSTQNNEQSRTKIQSFAEI